MPVTVAVTAATVAATAVRSSSQHDCCPLACSLHSVATTLLGPRYTSADVIFYAAALSVAVLCLLLRALHMLQGRRALLPLAVMGCCLAVERAVGLWGPAQQDYAVAWTIRW